MEETYNIWKFFAVLTLIGLGLTAILSIALLLPIDKDLINLVSNGIIYTLEITGTSLTFIGLLTFYFLLKGYNAKDIWLSLVYTYVIRKFSKTETTVSFVTMPDGTTKNLNVNDKIAKTTNHSLSKLSITFKNDDAKLVWYLPLTHESRRLAMSMFTDIKTELNQQTNGYVFSNITHDKGNRYVANGYKDKQ